MIQLSYDPAYDVYYAMFRMLRLREWLSSEPPLPKGKFRILDFYLQFPYLAADMRFRKGDQRLRTIAKKYLLKKPYGLQPDKKIIFDRMEPFQEAALQTLAINNFFSSEAYSTKEVLDTKRPLEAPLKNRILKKNEEDAELSELIKSLAQNYVFEGPDGLKDRTELLEYRYDSI